MHRKNLIEKHRYLIAGFLVAILLFVAYGRDFYGIQEKVSDAAEDAARNKDFELQDRCGPMPGGGGISHSIPNEEMCDNSCRARCVSEDLSYKSSRFTMSDSACHTCDCFCK